LKLLKGKRIDLEMLGRLFLNLSLDLVSHALLSVCMVIKVLNLSLVFCLSFCWYKVPPFGDTTKLGNLAKAGSFGFVGNFWDAFGRNCVL
jgi:hypothetical protein